MSYNAFKIKLLATFLMLGKIREEIKIQLVAMGLVYKFVKFLFSLLLLSYEVNLVSYF